VVQHSATTDKIEGLVRERQVKDRGFLKEDIWQTGSPATGIGQPFGGNVAAGNFGRTQPGHGDRVSASATAGIQTSFSLKPSQVKTVGLKAFGEQHHRFFKQIIAVAMPQIPKQRTGCLLNAR